MNLDPETVALCMDVYGDKALAQQAAAEIAHYETFGELPADAALIERIEEVNGALVIIHRDRTLQ